MTLYQQVGSELKPILTFSSAEDFISWRTAWARQNPYHAWYISDNQVMMVTDISNKSYIFQADMDIEKCFPREV